ncbi:MAG: nuclear transport factor 2 family protein [Ferruginibacter sp.]
MAKKNSGISSEQEASDVVLSFINAINQEDFTAARKCVLDTMTFHGVLGSRNGAEDYFNDMKKMKFKYDIKKVFQHNDDVCLLYDINMSGTTIFTCGWYHLEDGKIDSLRVIFDPRPVLEGAKK